MKSHRATISGENWSVHHAWSWLRSCWLRGPWTMVHQAARAWRQEVSLRCFWTCWHADMLLILGDSHVRTCTPIYTVQEAMPIQVWKKIKKILWTWNSSCFKNCGWPAKSQSFFLISASSFFGSSWWHFFSFWVWDWRILEIQCLTLTSRVQLCRALIAFARSGFAGAFDSDPHRV